MRVQSFRILYNNETAPGVYRLGLGFVEPVSFRPGQFMNVTIPGKPLKRPLSLAGYDDKQAMLVYRVAGEGTRLLSQMAEGMLEAIAPCGNGFTLPEPGAPVLAVGGGIGCAPLMPLIREAVRLGCPVHALFGFRTPDDRLFEKELAALGVSAEYTYDTLGENPVHKMLALGLERTPFYACGPVPMMKALCGASLADGQCSLETRMGCGFGACMGCSVRLKDRMARICSEGPVFRKGEIVWQNLR